MAIAWLGDDAIDWLVKNYCPMLDADTVKNEPLAVKLVEKASVENLRSLATFSKSLQLVWLATCRMYLSARTPTHGV